MSAVLSRRRRCRFITPFLILTLFNNFLAVKKKNVIIKSEEKKFFLRELTNKQTKKNNK